MRKALRLATAALALGLSASGCSLWPFGSESADAVPSEQPQERTGLAAAADDLLNADRAFAAKAVELGAAAAFAQFFDPQGVRLSAAGDPEVGPESVRAALAGGAARLISWEPRYAEVFASGTWGWTWGEWQAHEAGAGGRRVAQGRYVNVWKKQDDGSWKVRADLRSPAAAP